MAQSVKAEAIAQANAFLSNAGLQTYDELLVLLARAQNLGLNFDRGTAYIRADYIAMQREINSEINRAIDAANDALAELAAEQPWEVR